MTMCGMFSFYNLKRQLQATPQSQGTRQGFLLPGAFWASPCSTLRLIRIGSLEYHGGAQHFQLPLYNVH